MRLLLDTHIWLWSLIDPAQMSPRIAKELADPDNEIWLSPISTWEALMLARKGLIDLGGDPESWLREAWVKTGPKEAALTNEVVLQSCSLQLTHTDLADSIPGGDCRRIRPDPGYRGCAPRLIVAFLCAAEPLKKRR